jgi:hypothetical protein
VSSSFWRLFLEARVGRLASSGGRYEKLDIILTQIIAENAKERQISLPLQLLTQIVRASDKATHDFLSRYLNSTLDLYQKVQNSVNTRLSKAKKAALTPLDYVRNLLAAHSWPPTAEDGEVEQLRRRVEELQTRLAQPQQSARRAPQRGRRARGTATFL